MDIPPAALAALRRHMRLIIGKIRDDPAGFRLLYHSAQWHPDHQVRGAFAVASAAPAVFSVLSGIFSLVPEIRQGRQIGIRLKNDISAPAAVAAIRAAGRHVFFPAEGNRTVPAVACFNSNFRNVYEQERHLFLSLIIRRPPLFMCKKKSPGIFRRPGGFFIRFRITVPPRKR